MKQVVDLIRKVVTFKVSGYRQAPRLELNPIFLNHEQGAIVALEGFVREARALLAKHYFDVESTYYNAIMSLARLATGNYTPVQTQASSNKK